MTKILFVDDESNVLEALKRMLHPMRHEWEMTFVGSGELAMTAIGNTFFDVVVSDLRMPGMDGIQLLEKVRSRSPETVRIALSGYADKAETMRAVSQLHQFLAKPCDAETLRGVLTRAAALGEMLTDVRLKKLVSQMTSLPSLSTLFDEVLRLLETPDSSVSQIGEAIARDAGMSTKVLQLANSAMFGTATFVSSPVQAAILLGVDTMRLLVLTVKIFERTETEIVRRLCAEDVWQHCLTVARLAKRLALAEAASELAAERAFLAGLLHDTGKLVFASNMLEQYGSVLRLGGGVPSVTARLEKKMIGATHGEVGGYLMGLWGFSDDIIEAIAYHQVPSESTLEMESSPSFGVLTAVHVANAFANASDATDTETPMKRLDAEYIESMELTSRIPLWQEMCWETMNKGTHA